MRPIALIVFPAALAAAACAAPPASAQPDPQPNARTADEPLATLLTPNGEMRLRLTSRSLYVGFTALGHRRIQRAADRAVAATYGTHGAKGAKADSAGDDEAAPEKPDKPLPLRDVESVRASGDSLLLCFASKPGPGPGPAAPPCSLWRRFLITGLAPADAQRFAEAVRRARANAVHAPR